MKNLSKERLEKIVSWRETYGAEHNVVIPASEAEAMASELLYRRAGKAEPVAWRRVNSGYVTLSDVIAEDWMRQGFLVSPLYEWANVPAATVLSSRAGNDTSTPDEPQPASVDPRDEFEKQFPMPRRVERFGDGYRYSVGPNIREAMTFMSHWSGWTSCRDAMPQSGKTRDNKQNATRYAIVWNEGKTEGVVFNRELQSDDDMMNDIMCAGGGDCFSPYSALAESFCEHYGDGECTYQLIEIDTSDEKLTSISKGGEYGDDDNDEEE